MSKYRDRLQIIMDMLSVMSDSEGARKTRIMYTANLSWEVLVRYLNELLKAGLIRCGNSHYYVLTSEGKYFFKKCSDYHKRNKTVKEQLIDVESERDSLEKMVFNFKKNDEK